MKRFFIRTAKTGLYLQGFITSGKFKGEPKFDDTVNKETISFERKKQAIAEIKRILKFKKEKILVRLKIEKVWIG